MGSRNSKPRLLKGTSIPNKETKENGFATTTRVKARNRSTPAPKREPDKSDTHTQKRASTPAPRHRKPQLTHDVR
eukprot:6144960-Prymnesium_polylepis.1